MTTTETNESFDPNRYEDSACGKEYTAMYGLPTLNDSYVLATIGTHPEEFFEAMKEFEPYILIRASATQLEIKLKNNYVDLEKLEATFGRLNRLGYHPEERICIFTMPNGTHLVDIDSITIDWKEHDRLKGVK